MFETRCVRNRFEMSKTKIITICSFFLLQFDLTQDIGDVFKIRLGIIEPPKEEKEEKDNSSNKKKDKKKEEKEPAKKEGDENKQKMYSWYLEQV